MQRSSFRIFLHFLLILLIDFLPHISKSEVSPILIAQLHQKANLTRLADSTEWHRIGLWHKKGNGFVSDVDGGNFFLSPNGRSHPSEELHALIDAITKPIEVETGEENKKSHHAQCRFPARTAWIYEQLDIDPSLIPRHPCPERTEWKRKLDAEGVSIVFASAYMNNPASMFGHTFLKFHSRKNSSDRDLLNYGVSYWANTGQDGGIPFAWRGLSGAYLGYFSMAPYHEILRDYANLEGRDVWEYRLNLNPKETERLIDHLFELEEAHFDYFFFDENCASRLLAALEVARPELQLMDKFVYHVIPADSIRRIADVPGLFDKRSQRPALITTFNAAAKELTLNEADLVHTLAQSTDPSWQERGRKELEKVDLDRRIKVLNASLQYIDVLKAQKRLTFTHTKERAYRLKTWRASLGEDTSAIASIRTTEQAPELGHDSARAGLGLGTRNSTAFREIQLRPAYHDFLSDSTGYLENSHMEILRLSLRDFEGKTSPQINEAILIDLMSITSINRFFQPISWRAKFGLTRPPDLPPQHPMVLQVEGGSGLAWDPLDAGGKALLIFSMLQAHAEASNGFSSAYRIGASLQIQALVQPSGLKNSPEVLKKIRFNVGAEQRRYFFGDTMTSPSVWGRASVTLTRNLEFRWDQTENGPASERQSEAKATVFAHFPL